MLIESFQCDPHFDLRYTRVLYKSHFLTESAIASPCLGCIAYTPNRFPCRAEIASLMNKKRGRTGGDENVAKEERRPVWAEKSKPWLGVETMLIPKTCNTQAHQGLLLPSKQQDHINVGGA